MHVQVQYLSTAVFLENVMGKHVYSGLKHNIELAVFVFTLQHGKTQRYKYTATETCVSCVTIFTQGKATSFVWEKHSIQD